VIREDDWRRDRLRAHARRLRDGLAGLPWKLLPSEGAIQPLLIGENTAVLHVMQSLLDRGCWAPAIRPPPVPAGTARLRITLSAAHTNLHVDTLVAALVDTAASATAAARAA
jgi:8-amino-7-oxononanoate synthase